MSVSERFWPKVDRDTTDDGCWPWIAARNSSGYGWFKPGHGAHAVGAHRMAYELTHGPIPDGLLVLHQCDNPPCVRPDHLFLGTVQDNNADKMAKGRHPNSLMTQCRHGHPFDEANTYVTPKGNRMCRACNRAAQSRCQRRLRGRADA